MSDVYRMTGDGSFEKDYSSPMPELCSCGSFNRVFFLFAADLPLSSIAHQRWVPAASPTAPLTTGAQQGLGGVLASSPGGAGAEA